MNININENFENYHEDFIKGLSKREAAYAGAILVTGIAVYAAGLYLLGLPPQACTYLILPFCIPIGILGFYKNHGMTFLQWYRRMSEVHGSPPYVYKTEFLLELEDMRADPDWPDGDRDMDAAEEIYFDSLGAS